jgi:hypothetical protein
MKKKILQVEQFKELPPTKLKKISPDNEKQRQVWLSETTKNQSPKLIEKSIDLDELKSMLLSRKQVCEILSVSYVTLFNYKKRNVLIPIKIQGKVYYKRQDLLDLINSKIEKS